MVKVIVQRSPIRPGVQAPDGDSGEPTFVFRSAVSGRCVTQVFVVVVGTAPL